MRARVIVGMLIAGGLVAGSAGPVLAAHFEKRNQQTDRNVPPTPGPGEAAACPFSFTALADATVLPDLIKIGLQSSLSLTGDDPSCNFLIAVILGEIISAEVVADGGDSIGAPVPFCLHFDRFQSASTTGAYMADSDVGGGAVPDANPVIVARSTPGVVIEFSDGPTVVNSGVVRQSFQQQFIANVGDFIDVSSGVQSGASGTGIGAANVSAISNLTVRIGSCGGTGAPAVSHSGLVGLALALSAGGMLLLRRRSIRRSTPG